MRDADLQVATEGDAGRAPPRVPGPSLLLLEVQPPRLHAAAAVRLPRGQGAAEAELPRGGGPAAGRRPLVQGARDATGAGPQHAVPRRGRMVMTAPDSDGNSANTTAAAAY